MSIEAQIVQDMAQHGRTRPEAELVVTANFAFLTESRLREIGEEIQKAYRPSLLGRLGRSLDLAQLLSETRAIVADATEAHELLATLRKQIDRATTEYRNLVDEHEHLMAIANAAECLRAYCHSKVTGEHSQNRDRYLEIFEADMAKARVATLRSVGLE